MMSLGLSYIIVLAVAVLCGFLGRNKPTTKLNMVAAVVMLAGIVYAGINYSWFHLLGMVGITLVGINVFNAAGVITRNRLEEKARVDKIFSIDDEKDDEN